MLSEKSQTEKHVLYVLHDFLEEAKQQAQKRDQWMLEAWVGEGTINGSEMFCILIVAVVP